MKIATVLPTAHLHLEAKSKYHLCLAHQIKKDPAYALFFTLQAATGAFVIMDNGIVETGRPLPTWELIELASTIKCQEMVLPDSLYNSIETLQMSLKALLLMGDRRSRGIKLMAVPQGRTPRQWAECVREMLTWDVDTIGITRFLVPDVFTFRHYALNLVPEIVESDKDIHILGCPGNLREVAEINAAFPGRIRGVDSGIAAIYAQEGMSINDGKKPAKEIDLDTVLGEDLLKENIRIWKEGCI